MLSAMTAANTQAQENDKGGHRGLDFTISPGYQINTGDGGGGAVSAEVSLGKRFNKNFYCGLTSGALIPTGDGDVQIPIAADFKMFFPLKTKTFTPGFMVRGGYVINTSDGYDVPTGKHHSAHVDAPDFILLQAMPTIDMKLNGAVDFVFGVGYAHYIATKGGNSSGAVALNAAFNFHKSTTGKRGPMGEARERGIELATDIGWGYNNNDNYCTQAAFNLAALYKFNPKLSAGIGLGIDYMPECLENFSSTTTLIKKFFVSGEYRFNTNNITPFVSLDAGVNITPLDTYVEEENEEKTIHKSCMYVAPAIGMSFRVATNSYFKLKAGYSFSANAKDKFDWGEDYLEEAKIELSKPFISFGYTHTFSWGENWFK